MNKADLISACMRIMPADEAAKLSMLYASEDSLAPELLMINDLIEIAIYRGVREIEVNPYSLSIRTISEPAIAYLKRLGYKVKSYEVTGYPSYSDKKYWIISW